MKEDKDLKVLLLKSQYISEEYDTVKDAMSIYRHEFYEEFPEEYERMIKASENNFQSSDEESEDSTSEEDIEESEEQDSTKIISKTMRSLYRRISKITHPDKVDSTFLNNYFKKASTAYSEGNLADLFVIANFLDIKTEDLDLQDLPKDLKESINKKSMEIYMIKNSLAWQWAHAETEEEKDNLRKILKKHTDENF